ncbi:MAG: 6-phosphofructokinase [Pseudomonadota bacterium]|uniref:6-phosphofructokinase n=1 Tax=Candidatus Desulfatibia profunda TaxID=2841695 RepID=A0A8J6TG39_9BACT|nr:6-phosphofructokinase [Candidatus Desulfatibia profunda]MBL7180493.1 6-phosphofructokinase [Desulfobacterales bacterium]
MKAREPISVGEILKHPAVQKVTGNINQEAVERREYQPPVCNVFSYAYTMLEDNPHFEFEVDNEARKHLPGIIDNKVQTIVGVQSPEESFKEKFHKKRNIGIVFSGGPAPGGHNVIAGLFDAAQKANPENRIYGFLLGPDGIIENEAIEITGGMVDKYRNLGGFTMIKTGRAKIDTKEKMALSKETCKQLGLDALVIVGGDDSNTNAAFLAQEMLADGIQVIGVPKTIDGDIQVRDANGNVLCAMSFGFHTAARAFATEIGNLCTDSSSDVKYWHICKVMGRVASHLALEVALQTHANITLIGEDLADYVDQERIEKAVKEGTINYQAYGMTLRHLSRVICDGIVRRAAVGKNYGVIVIPEGVLEFINEIQMFIIKLNTIIAEYNQTHDTDFHTDFPVLEDKLEYLRRLAARSKEDTSFTIWNMRDNDLFNDIPEFFQEGLLTERDSHGNFQFSQVETDKVIMEMVTDYLDFLKENGTYKMGIERSYYQKTLNKGGLDPDFFGPILFKNYDDAQFLLMKPSIMSVKTLKQALVKEGAISEADKIPAPIEKIFKKSVPKFSTQLHFYGYDGRGNDPTRFDCMYTYNLGLTVFSLIAKGATGQMAAIRNLEKDFAQWEPIGIPIAPLMHLEERKGKLTLVLEKSIVDIDSPAFKVAKAFRERWQAATPGDDNYRRPGPIRFTGKSEEDRPITLVLNALDSSN